MYDKWHSAIFRRQFLREVSNILSSQEPDFDTIDKINAKLASGEKCIVKIEPDKVYSNETLRYEVQKIDHWGWAECSSQTGSIELLALTNADLANLLHKSEVILFQYNQKIEQFWRLISLAMLYEVQGNFNADYYESGRCGGCEHCGSAPYIGEFQDFQKIFKLLDFLMQDRKWVNDVKRIARRKIRPENINCTMENICIR